MTNSRNIIAKRHRWTIEDDEYLRRIFPDTSTELIAEKLNLRYHQVSNRAYVLGVKKTPEYLAENGGRLLSTSGIAHRYSKGNIPANKGKKMDTKTRKKVSKTWFEKGHEPHNTKYNGYERIDSKDGYILVRVAKGEFKPKHHIVWEKHFGKIPNNHIVIFKDKNILNITPENLECITKEENMRRNTIHRYPEELKQAIRLQGKLTREISKNEK